VVLQGAREGERGEAAYMWGWTVRGGQRM
jgi:hypothetical protein